MRMNKEERERGREREGTQKGEGMNENKKEQ